MQVSRNEQLIKRRSRLGTYATFGGLGVLVLGMVASFRVQYLWVSMGALLVGFALSQFGSYYLRRWGRSPRPDELLETALKGFDDRYHLYVWSLPASFVLLSPQGIYNLITRDQTGEITVDGSRWRSKMTFGRALTIFAQEGLGNPTQEALESSSKLEAWIKSALPDVNVSVQPTVVFTSDRAELHANAPVVPVLESKGLKKWLRSGSKGDSLRNADYRAIEQLFDQKSAS